MPIDFTGLTSGESYDRPFLAKKWGYASWHAFGRGVFTPSKEHEVILFVTRVKQEALVQYQDHFEGDTLFMEGERGPSGDATNSRLRHAKQAGDRITLFYRDRHHTDFTYFGEVSLKDVRTSKGQVVFVFETKRLDVVAENALATEAETHGEETFIGDEEGRSRLRRHVAYERSARNRAEAIRLNGTVCKACGFDFNGYYGPDLARDYVEMHHVESVTKRVRIIRPSVDLIPLCANCHSMVHRRRGVIMSVDELRKRILQRTVRKTRV